MTHNRTVSHAAKIGSKLISDIANKHEEGEFLKAVAAQNPFLYKKTQVVLDSYCDLLVQLSQIFKKSNECTIKAEKELEVWLDNLQKTEQLENQLYFDLHLTDIGENH
jgi:hypothetical protein